jgi:hypothetical protein
MKIGSVMALGLMMAATLPAGAVALVRIMFAGRAVTTAAPVVGFSAGTLVPLRATAAALGGRLEWDPAARKVVVRYKGRRLEVDERAHSLRLDGEALGGLVSPRTARGHLLVPLTALERLFNVQGRWLPRQKLLRFASAPDGPAAQRTSPNTQHRTPNTEHRNGLQLRLTSPRPSYATGAPVPLTLTVTNPGRSPLTLQFSSSQQYDFEVRREGQVVWRWSADRMFTQALTSLTLNPGTSLRFTETWKQQDNNGQPVPPGTYEVVATLTTMTKPQPQSTPLALRIGS